MNSLNFSKALSVPLFLISLTNLALNMRVPSSTSDSKAVSKTPFSSSPITSA
jgi:hypothetical protein